MNKDSTATDTISLPKGGAAHQGIGETFTPDLFTGAGNFSIPIAASAGRDGFGPQLTLQYSTGNGNSPFGLGWQLSIPRVTRKTEKGLPRYTNEDTFILSGAEDLVLSDSQPFENSYPGYQVINYRPRTEGMFARIEKWTRSTGNNSGDVHWRVVTKDNVVSIYGKSKSARTANPDQPQHVYEWLLEEAFDNRGNHVLYEYVQEDSQFVPDEIYEQNRSCTQTYLRRVLYGNTPESLDENRKVGHRRTATHHLSPTQTFQRHYVFELLFDYGDVNDLTTLHSTTSEPVEMTIPHDWPLRNDRISSFRAGFELRTRRRCRRVLMLHHFEELDGAPLVRSTDFEFETEPRTGASLLKSAQATGHRKDGTGYLSRSLPPVTFGYSTFEPDNQHYQSVTVAGNDLPPRSLADPDVSLIDLFGDGLPDIVHSTDNGIFYWRNLGDGHLDRRHVQHDPVPAISFAASNVSFGDMGGDGIVDLIVQDEEYAGFYESTPDGRWQPFRKFDQNPSVDPNSANVRMVDLTGDGLTDILMTSDHHFLWFRNLGEEGFDEPRHVKRIFEQEEFPNVDFSDSTGRVRLADMSGDGLSDIVLIHDGRIDYWPNLGYGRFGKRITMANCPRFEWGMDPTRIFLVDLDGTGCSDLVYVDSDHVDFWFNQTGNGWSEKETIDRTPLATNSTSIQFADFFGTGTASLIWSDDYQRQTGGNYKVLDFCGGQKPLLLTEMSNNMGATTRVQYASSTKFFLADEKEGKPWATNLPMPVQVVEKSEAIDHISKTKLVTSYKYHHGYYDGREREFRGFGRVDQYDTEEFELFSQSSSHGVDVEFTNNDRAYHVPPVLTKSWFHTGVYFDDDNISPSGEFYDHQDLMEAYRHEFYQGDSEAFEIRNHQVQHSDNPHEAYRALRGAQLRSEVYGLDGTGKSYHPYVVSESRYGVSELQQKKNNNSHGVYLTTQLESFNYQYERNPADPRIGHELVLAIDKYGQVTDSVSITYPRRKPLIPEQSDARLIYSHVDYINQSESVNFLYLGIPFQSRSYEVTGVEWHIDSDPVHADSLASIVDESPAVGNFRPYRWKRPENHSGIEKRILEWSRSYFRSDESSSHLDISVDGNGFPKRTLGNRLPLGEIDSLMLPYEDYSASLFDESLLELFGDFGGVPDSIVLEGGYHREPDVNGVWWSPSGQQSFDSTCFFQAKSERDPFGNDSAVVHDSYIHSIVEIRDSLENKTTATFDYRVLQPSQVEDPNGNWEFVVFDALGLVVGTASQSKTGEGDTLDGFVADLTDKELQDFFTQPEKTTNNLLAGASSRHFYDSWAFYRGQNQRSTVARPTVVSSVTREIHQSQSTNSDISLQRSFLYLDGLGREIQTKAQAESKDSATGRLRWVGSGSTIYNNKGNVVRQYEPFFSDSHEFGIEQHGQSPTIFYDPLDRVIFTLHPNHSYSKVVFDSWMQEIWDLNDTIHLQDRWGGSSNSPFPDYTFDPVDDPDIGHFLVGMDRKEYFPSWYRQRMDPSIAKTLWPNEITRSLERDAARKASRHAATPAIQYLDTLGRTVRTIADNGHLGKYVTQIVLDVEGNETAFIDAQDRIIASHELEMDGSILKQVGMDDGARWLINDVGGSPIRAWDSRGHRFRNVYDALRRPVETYLGENGDPVLLVERTVYGESQTNPESRNLRGQVVQQFDQAGVVTNDLFDFKGNSLQVSRQFAEEYYSKLDWSKHVPLSPESFVQLTRYDALNRPIQLIAPHSDRPGSELNVVQPDYNEANLVESVRVWQGVASVPEELLDPSTASQTVISNIQYDAKGQRKQVNYGNGVCSNYVYDEMTFRLIHLVTRRDGDVFPADCPNPATPNWPGCDVQNLHYFHDPVGNITHIRDEAQQAVFFKNQRVQPDSEYEYDALYRLVRATGREHLGQTGSKPAVHSPNDPSRIGRHHPSDGNALGRFEESYLYDEVGNLLEMRHRGSQQSQPGWTRTFQYVETSAIESGQNGTEIKYGNRLTSTTLGNQTQFFSLDGDGYDSHGSMLSLPHLSFVDWDHRDQLSATSQQVVTDGTPNKTYYVYDSTGERVRKVTERGGTRVSERIYLGNFEVYREFASDGNTTQLQRETLHVMEDHRRIAQLESVTIDLSGSQTVPFRLTRFQYENHLGSVSLELDQDAKIISYEEYTPFGSTSFQAVRSQVDSAKRYGYSGKERDDETGFIYYGARYYAPWLARWTAADPIGISDGANLYEFSGNNPIVWVDPNGTNVMATWADREIGGRSDTDLAIHLKSLSPSQRGALLQDATEPFRRRARLLIGSRRVVYLPEEDVLPEDTPAPKPAKSKPAPKLPRTFEKCYKLGHEPPLPPETWVEPERGPSVSKLREPGPVMVIARQGGKEVWRGTLDQVNRGFWYVDQTGATTTAEFEVIEPIYPRGLDDDSSQSSASPPANNPKAPVPNSRRGRSYNLQDNPGHLYEIRWINTKTGETGVYKYGISRAQDAITQSGHSRRALDQISQLNRMARQVNSPLRFLHGRMWTEATMGTQLRSPQVHWMERYKVTEHYELHGHYPAGQRQRPTRFKGRKVPPPPMPRQNTRLRPRAPAAARRRGR